MAKPKTETKTKTKSEKTSSSFAHRLIDAQKRALELQKSTFERGYGLVTSMQERQEEALTTWLEGRDRMPSQAVELAHTWIGAQRTSREAFRGSVERSFDLARSYVDGLAQ